MYVDASPHRALHVLDATLFWNAAGGVHRAINAKSAALRARGWRHTVFAPGACGPGQVDAGGVPVPGTGGYRALLGVGRAARAIEELRPVLIEAADPYTLGHAAQRAAHTLGVPAVAFCHSDLPRLAARLMGGLHGTAARLAERLARAHLRQLYAKFDLVLAPSRYMTERLREWGVEHALHQPLGVDTRIFHPRLRDERWRSALWRALGVPQRTQLLLYCGRFAPEKRLPLLCEAVRRLGAGHVLLALGDGPCAPTGDRVRVLPTRTDAHAVALLMANVDVFVHAGNEETFGLGALEAMACRTPVVSADAAGLGELVGGAGLTLASDDPAQWAEALAATLVQPSLACSPQALERALAHDWRPVLDRWLRRYVALTDSAPLRRSPTHPARLAAAE